MITNESATIFCKYYDKATKTEFLFPTFFPTVSWYEHQKSALTSDGSWSRADVLTVRIPADLFSEKSYVDDVVYRDASIEAARNYFWTIQAGDIIVRGDHVRFDPDHIYKESDVNRLPHAFVIQGGSDNIRGSQAMWHYRIEAI